MPVCLSSRTRVSCQSSAPGLLFSPATSAALFSCADAVRTASQSAPAIIVAVVALRKYRRPTRWDLRTFMGLALVYAMRHALPTSREHVERIATDALAQM